MFKITVQKHKGFTLIELLVVMAIIALLASLILVSTASVRQRSKDKRIALEMDQIRKAAEIYKGPTGSYSGLDCSVTNPSIDKVCSDINSQNGGTDPTFKVSTNGSQYCFYVVLASSTSKWYCIDSSGKSAETTTNPSGTGYCTTTTFTCP
jgi:prepilin-type N-terminal cleavage/methylation domain-containing protein